MINFKHMTEQEINDQKLAPEGRYPFSILQIRYLDDNGNPMITTNGNQKADIKLAIIDSNGAERHIYDSLVFHPSMMFKIKHFMETIGCDQDYENDKFDAQSYIGKRGMVHIIVKKGEPKKDIPGEYWNDKNVVKDYVKISVKSHGNDFIDDKEIPF